MIDLLQLANDPALAQRCDALPGMRLFVDLERDGKAQRQAGRSTFISDHQPGDIPRMKAVLQRSRLMVRLNPLGPGTASEVAQVVAGGADVLMLPMFFNAAQVREFSAIVGGRRPFVALLETAAALESLPQWLATPGLEEVFVGLNDLHLSLGLRFMFEPLARGLLDDVARHVLGAGLRFGFGGIARADEGLLPGRDVLAEHLRLGSRAVILSRTFRQAGTETLEQQIAALRAAEQGLSARSPAEIEQDRVRIADRIGRIAAGMGPAS